MNNSSSTITSYKKVFKLIYQLSSGMSLARFVAIPSTLIFGMHFSVFPLLIGKLVDSLFSPTKGSAWIWVLANIFWWILLFGTTALYERVIHNKAIPEMRTRLQLQLLKKLLIQDAEFYQEESAGSLIGKITMAGSKLRQFLDSFFWGIIKNTCMFLFSIPALAMVSWPVLGLTIVWMTYITYQSFVYANKIQVASTNEADVQTDNSGRLIDALHSIRTIRFFNCAKYEAAKGKNLLEREANASKETENLFIKIWDKFRYSFTIFFSVTLLFMVHAALNGSISVGEFILVFQIIGISAFFWWFLIFDFTNFSSAVSAIAIAIETIEEKTPKITDSINASVLEINNGIIEFKNVCFGYPKSTDKVFDNLSFKIESGQKVGLVGPSGSGKTTLINLLLRNFDPESGQIIIDGQDTKLVTLESLRNAIALIEQEPTLFDRTLLENLKYGKPDATEKEVLQAARLAHADNFINSLADGYNSTVGERGSKLSGGQRQRIAIARAVLKNSPIIVFDEATSQLDTIVEQDIKEALHGALANKTVISVAHRLSTIEQMDRILVFENGKIVQDGPHKILAQVPGLYQSLLEAQKNKTEEIII